MNENSQSARGKRKIVWFVNIAVALLCLLSILCYFFGPVWQINLTYTITADQFQEMVGSNLDFDFDAHEVIGEEGEKITVSASLSAGHVLGAFTSADETVDKILDSNINNVINQLTPALNGIAKKVVKSVAKNTVKSEVKNNVKKFLTKDDGSEMSEEEVTEKLEGLGFTDDYISEKTDQLIEDVFAGGSDIDTVTENIMDTVDEVYQDFQRNSAGKEGYEEFQDVELSEEDKAAIEDTIRDTLDVLANEDGTIDPDELIAELLAQALSATQNGGGTEGEKENGEESGAADDFVLLADGDAESGSSKDKLASALKDKLNELLSDSVRGYMVYVFYGMAGLMIFSMIPWAYVLLKLIVKLARKDKNPTVKLALPIWFGWLFFLILVAIPSIALGVLNMPAVSGQLAQIGGLKNLLSMMQQINFTITSISWISMICTIIAFAISIYYMVVRRQLKKIYNSPETTYNNTTGGDTAEEVAVSEE